MPAVFPGGVRTSDRSAGEHGFMWGALVSGAMGLGAIYATYVMMDQEAPARSENIVLTIQELQDHNRTLSLQVRELQAQSSLMLDRYTIMLAELEVRLVGLESVAQRVAKQVGFGGEFDFATPQGVGGLSQEAKEHATSQHEIQILIDRAEAVRSQLEVVGDLARAMDAQATSLQDGDLPVRWGWRTSDYGYRTDPFDNRRRWHSGVDYAAPLGSDVLAIQDGIVREIDADAELGNTVTLYHAGDMQSVYGHTAEILVEMGQRVKKGDTIARVGSTGRSTGPHLHLSIRLNGKTIDPDTILQTR